MTLLYISCVGAHSATVALDSLEIINCESGEFIVPYGALVDTFMFNLNPVVNVSSDGHLLPNLFKLEVRVSFCVRKVLLVIKNTRGPMQFYK